MMTSKHGLMSNLQARCSTLYLFINLIECPPCTRLLVRSRFFYLCFFLVVVDVFVVAVMLFLSFLMFNMHHNNLSSTFYLGFEIGYAIFPVTKCEPPNKKKKEDKRKQLDVTNNQV